MDPGEFERTGLLPKQSSDGRTSAKGRFVEGRATKPPAEMAVEMLGAENTRFRKHGNFWVTLFFHISPKAPNLGA